MIVSNGPTLLGASRPRRRRSLVRSAAITVVALLILGGCNGDSGGNGGGGGTGDAIAAEGVILTVFVADQEVTSWTLARISDTLDFVTLTVDGDEQHGPLLTDLLSASGVTSWSTAEVLGKGESRSFDVGLDVSFGDVSDFWILDVTNRGTLKLVSSDLPRGQWVRDVGEIRIP